MSNRIAIVDDDEAVRNSLSAVLRTHGFGTKSYADAAEALEHLGAWNPDCIVADVRMPGMDGLAMQKILAGTPSAPPVILITGHGDIAMAVRAMKEGAYDFIEKPVDDELLANSIRAAIAARRANVRDKADTAETLKRFQSLTERERTIATMVSEGYSTSAIASRLGISSRTVDHHRASIMAKMQATSLPQLMKHLLGLDLPKQG